MFTNQTLEKSLLAIDHKRISPKDFTSILPVHCQRPEEPRHKAVKKILDEKLLPTHLEVACVIPMFSDDYYSYGQPYSVNGNTRKFIWNKYPDSIPTENLHVTLYYPSSRNEVEKIYRSIDSSNSVESSGHLIGGLFRSNGYVPQSRKMKAGNIGVSIRHAYACITGNSRIYGNELTFSDIKGKIEFNFLVDEIKFVDGVILSYENEPSKNKKYTTGPIMASLIIMAKKYGVNNPRLQELVDHLINNKIDKHEGVGGLNDGVSVVNIDLYERYNGVGSRQWSLQSEGFGPVIIGNLIYCFDAFMNNTLININRSNSVKGTIMKDDKAILYMRNYFAKD